MAETAVITPEREALLRALASQAAAWWRAQLQAPGYAHKFNNGDRSRDGEMGQILASMVALRSPQPNAERLERFEQLLAERVLACLLRDPSPVYQPSAAVVAGSTAEQLAAARARAARDLVLSVDYGPEGELRRAAEEAGVSGFPWKTTMWVEWDAREALCSVEVRAGYGASPQRLPAPQPTPTTA